MLQAPPKLDFHGVERRKLTCCVRYHVSLVRAAGRIVMAIYGLYSIASLIPIPLGVYGNGTVYTQYGGHLQQRWS